MIRLACVALLGLSLVSLAARSTDARDGNSPASIAMALIPRYVAAQDPASLVELTRLQLAAGRFADAEATLDRLKSAYQAQEPRLVPTLVPWKIYARARAYEAAGESSSQAIRRAFSELHGSLTDQQVVAIYPWYGANLDSLRNEATAQANACAAAPPGHCATAAEWLSARQALATWQYLSATLPMLRADAERRFLIDDHVLVPRPDGGTIAAIVVRPRVPASVKTTALLNFTIYADDEWSMGDALAMAAHGYVGVVAYTRGKGRGTGKVTPYVHDGEDATTVIQWLSKQPWSDGRVGMFSGSYNGFTQWAAAKHHPAALKAIATNATNAPGIDTPMQGNVFQSFIYPWPFYTTDTKALDNLTYGDKERWARLARSWYRSGRPYRDLDKIDGKPNPIFDQWLDHPSYDAYWQRLIPFEKEFAGIDIPVFVETGYFDGGMVGALYYFQEHLKYRPAANDRMLIGPYHHTAMQTGVLATIDGQKVDRAAMIDLAAIRLAWFDHVFRASPLPALLSDRVNFQVMGSNQWRHVASVADMATSPWRLFLTARHEGNRLRLDRKPDATPPPPLVVNLADRKDVDIQPPEGIPDMRHALVFETPPLTSPLEVDGLFHARLEVTSNKRDFDLSINLYELTADGHYVDLSSYLGRASYMEDRTQRHLLSIGKQRILDIQSQTVAGRLLSKGSRIVAMVAIPKTPFIQINYGTGRDVSDESVADAGEPLEVQWSASSYLDIGIRNVHQALPGCRRRACIGLNAGVPMLNFSMRYRP